MGIINEFYEFILEKRIDQISSSISIKIDKTYGYDLIKTKHATERSNFSKRGLEGDNQNNISNKEMKEFVRLFIKDISISIAKGDIIDGTNFVIRSRDKSLSMAIIADFVEGTYWKLIIKTVFRESDKNQLKIARNQIIFEK